MDLLLLELICWGGLIFFFWALKDGLGQVESEIDSLGVLRNGSRLTAASAGMQYARPEQVTEPIGTYQDMQIYRYAVINGRKYLFDRVCPAGSSMAIDPQERCVAPGLVYQECPNEPQPYSLP